jgi:DNA replication protein DnaC
MNSPFDPSPNINCPKCRGDGYTTNGKREHSQAFICSCIPICQRCNGVGYRTKEKESGLISGRCRCQKLVDRIHMFNRTLIPTRHGKDSFRNFQHTSNSATLAIGIINSWVHNFGKNQQEKGLVLTGEVGRGKTHLLIGMCKTLVFEYGISTRFIEFSRLLSMLKESYSKGLSDSSIINELINVDVLAIDELGKGRLTEWEMAIIDEIISRRYNAMKTIIGTSNYSWKIATGTPTPNLATHAFNQTLGDRVGMRTFSRLQEMCICFEVKGTDFRSLGKQFLS